MIRVTATNVTNNAARIAASIERNGHRLMVEFAQDHQAAAADIMKDSPSTSAPGNPPNVHSPSPNLESYGHYVDLAKKEVVSGPLKINGSVHYSRPLPNVLEFGGVVTIRRNRSYRGRGRNRKRRKSRNQNQQITMRYRARPVVVPSALVALERMRSRVQSRGLAR